MFIYYTYVLAVLVMECTPMASASIVLFQGQSPKITMRTVYKTYKYLKHVSI